MDAIAALSTFVRGVLVPERASWFIALSDSRKGRQKLLRGLDHDLERAIRANAKHRLVDRLATCFVFHRSVEFGTPFVTVAKALDRLSPLDGWLIVAADGSAGIYRPESNWDATVELTF